MSQKRQLFSEAYFPVKLGVQDQDFEGMSYSMVFQPTTFGTPGGAYIERQSIRQQVLKHRTQFAVYISRYMTGLQAQINYPIARGNAIVNTAPDNIGAGPSGRQGTMVPPSRFGKALPLPVVPYNPPTY